VRGGAGDEGQSTEYDGGGYGVAHDAIRRVREERRLGFCGDSGWGSDRKTGSPRF
jgi:hypothetical protein